MIRTWEQLKNLLINEQSARGGRKDLSPQTSLFTLVRDIIDSLSSIVSSVGTFLTLKVGSSTSYTEFGAGGLLTMIGNARINRHHYIISEHFKKPAANFPDDGWEGVYYTSDFDKTTEQSVYYTINIPYRQDSSTDMHVHMFWLHDTNQANADIFARFGFEYHSVAEGEAVAGGSTTITHDSAGHNTDQGKLILTTFTTKILAANIATHDQLAFRFYRDVADNFTEDVRVVAIHIGFTMNKLGESL